MDLNIDNYGYNDILSILNIDGNGDGKRDNDSGENSVSLQELQKSVSTKITHIMDAVDFTEIQESREDLIEFFMNCYFKCFTIIKNKSINANLERYTDLLKSAHTYAIEPPARPRQSELLHSNNDINSNNRVDTTFISAIKQGTINPLTVKTYTQIVNINTMFRDNYNGSSATDFTIVLPLTLKKVISMKLLRSSIARAAGQHYNVSDNNASNTFILNATEIKIPDGIYRTAGQFVDKINQAIQDKNNGDPEMSVSLEYDDLTGKMRFFNTHSPPSNFSLDFNTNNHLIINNQNQDFHTLGWLLGFRGDYGKPTASKNVPVKKGRGGVKARNTKCDTELEKNDHVKDAYYFDKTEYIGEAFFNILHDGSCYLAVDDYQNNHNDIFISPFKYQTASDTNIIAKIHTYKGTMQHYSDTDTDTEYPARIYFGPTDLTKLHVRLYDIFGRIIHNNIDYSMELLCELIYEKP